MIENKRGLSDIVITLLIVVLSLVAIGGVWVVVGNVLTGQNKQASNTAKCMGITIEATRVNCSNGATNKMCTVALSKIGTETISGAKLIFKNITSGVQSSAAVDFSGDVAELVGTVKTVDTLVVNANGLNTVEVIPYFTDTSGNVQPCQQQKTSFKFIAG